MLFFRDSVYMRGTNFKLFADTLAFNTENRIAYFIGPTRIVLRETDEIYCEDGYYDVANDNALFTQNAIFSNTESEAVSDSMFYVGNENLVILKDSAKLLQDDQIASADIINYYRSREDLWLLGMLDLKIVAHLLMRIVYYTI